MTKNMYNGIIYKYTSPSGKVYIGLTTDENRRKKEFLDLDNSYAGQLIDNARSKYGPENFQYEVLTTITSTSLEEICDLLDFSEQYYIEKYDSYNNGYNLTEGGATFRLWLKTQELVLKLRMSLRKYYETNDSASNKAVLLYTLEGDFVKEWKSASEADRSLGYKVGNVSKICLGKGNSAMGFMWRYKESNDFPVKIEPCKVKCSTKKHSGLLQLTEEGTLIKEWKNTAEATKALGIKSASQISEVCRGKRKSAAGYLWRYKELVKLIGENKYEL